MIALAAKEFFRLGFFNLFAFAIWNAENEEIPATVSLWAELLEWTTTPFLIYMILPRSKMWRFGHREASLLLEIHASYTAL